MRVSSCCRLREEHDGYACTNVVLAPVGVIGLLVGARYSMQREREREREEKLTLLQRQPGVL